MQQPTAHGGLRSEINVTPLVDVCLVLLIIFMIVTPMLFREMTGSTPGDPEDPGTPVRGKPPARGVDAGGSDDQDR